MNAEAGVVRRGIPLSTSLRGENTWSLSGVPLMARGAAKLRHGQSNLRTGLNGHWWANKSLDSLDGGPSGLGVVCRSLNMTLSTIVLRKNSSQLRSVNNFLEDSSWTHLRIDHLYCH